jgi:iron complex outermembrane receptor protein
MEDIDRIEVIRGTGTSIWGANAINGIINIITKSSADTQGLMVSALYGTTEPGTASIRYGGRVGEKNAYRAYAKYRSLDALDDIDGNELHDGQESILAGFRMDLMPDGASTLVLHGDAFTGAVKGSVNYPDLAAVTMLPEHSDTDVLSASTGGRYERNLGDGSVYSLQVYYDREARDADTWDLTVDTADVDFQYQFVPVEGHVAQWGLGYRLTRAELVSRYPGVTFDDETYADNMFSAFLQDEVTLGDWVLTVGSKFQYNDEYDLQVLPSARLLWHADKAHAVWGAVSRAVRIPSIVEQNAATVLQVIPTPGMPTQVSLLGNDGVREESAVMYELGYRYTPSNAFSFDASGYVTKTDDMIDAGLDPSAWYMAMNPPHIQLDAVIDNQISGTIYGLEANARWSPVEWWRLQGWYSFCEDDYDYSGDGENIFGASYGKISPRHQFFVRTSFDLPYDTELDVMGRYVSELPGLGISDYMTMDVRLGWRPAEHVEVSLVGRNLIERRHQETSTELLYGVSGAPERSAFLKLRMDF